MAKDFLDEVVAERTKANAAFRGLVDAAIRRRQLLEELTAEREALGLSQTVVAARMHFAVSGRAYRVDRGRRQALDRRAVCGGTGQEDQLEIGRRVRRPAAAAR